jgi:hypothetical protein
MIYRDFKALHVVKCVVHTTSYKGASCKSTKSRHSHESGSPELIDFTGFLLSQE